MAASKKSTRMPSSLIELLDVAIFQFASMSGLRLSHKLRGDPVLEGVSAVFAQVLACAKAEIQKELESSSSRLGNWKPGLEPTRELKTLISGRIRQNKDEFFRKSGEPAVPVAVVHREQEYDEECDRVVVRSRDPRCWRCRECCRYCKENGTNTYFMDGFKPDLIAPLLEAVEDFESAPEEEENEELGAEYAMDEEVASSLYAAFKNSEKIEDSDDDDDDDNDDEVNESSEEEVSSD